MKNIKFASGGYTILDFDGVTVSTTEATSAGLYDEIVNAVAVGKPVLSTDIACSTLSSVDICGYLPIYIDTTNKIAKVAGLTDGTDMYYIKVTYNSTADKVQLIKQDDTDPETDAE